MDHLSIHVDGKFSDRIKEGQVMGVIREHQETSTFHTSVRDRQQSQVSKILNQSMNKLSIINDISHRTSPTYAPVVLKSHISTSYIEMDDHSEKDQITSLALKESAPCHLKEEKNSKIEDITLGSKAFSQHA